MKRTGMRFHPLLLLPGIHAGKQLSGDGPAANVYENDATYKIVLVAPGFEREDFTIEITDDFTLIISAALPGMESHNPNDLKHLEYAFRDVKRTFQLPKDALADETHAIYENGLLILNIPKDEKTPPQTSIKIKIH